MKLITAVLLASFSTITFANDIIFSCNMGGGKKLTVSKQGDSYQYKYGSNQKPELVFLNKENDIDMGVTTNGETGARMKSIDMHNKGYAYTINSTKMTAGVTVFNGKTYTTYQCKLKTIVNHIPDTIM